ncbi:hypothetical protein GRC12_31115 [Streptomyces griseorubiginosus]|nr:hypothetical protein [Streptomyces griseorubiginosus]
MMPSVTVLVSSDTDIYISPGLYGDCLPTVATGKAADSFRAGACLSASPSCSHTGRRAENDPSGFTSHRRYDHRQSDVNRVMIDNVRSTKSRKGVCRDHRPDPGARRTADSSRPAAPRPGGRPEERARCRVSR